MFWTLRRILLLIMVISTITALGTLIWVGITYQRFAIDTMQDATGKIVRNGRTIVISNWSPSTFE